MTHARVDFTKVLDDIAYLLGDARLDNPLLRDPCSQEKLAEALDVPRGTLRGWIDGSEPRHADGEKLLVTWCRLTGKARTFAPASRVLYSAHKVTGPIPRRRHDDDHGAASSLAGLESARSSA